MERRWPYNTEAAKAFRRIKAVLTHNQPDPCDIALGEGQSRGIKRRWPANTRAADLVRDVRGLLNPNRK